MLNRTDTITTAPRGPRDTLGRRAVIVGTLFVSITTLMMAGLLWRIVGLQARPPAPIAQLVDTQASSVTLRARRATMTDRRGRPIAVTRPVSALFVDPRLIVDHSSFSEKVGFNLDYDPAWIEQQLARRPDSRFVLIDRRLSDERATRISQIKAPPGLGTQIQLVRDYPNGKLAGQLIGFVGTDGIGLDGLERAFEQQLAGQPGRLVYLRDARSDPVWIDRAAYRPPTDGQPIRLSLDITIQAIAEAELAHACRTYGAKSGELIVMHPKTGQILAMANYPPMDPNRFAQADPQTRRNRCVTDVFEPGSIFKPFIWAPVLQAGLARPEEQVDTTTIGLWIAPGGRRLHDAHPNGLQDWDGVLIQSSNIGMAKVSARLGNAGMFAALQAMGFGKSTGSGLPGEVGGIVTPLPKWTKYTITSVPMGQEIAVTPLQVTRAFCVIANDGNMVTPTILARQPQAAHDLVPILERVLAPEVAAHTRQVLRRVVTEGTGRKANSKLYTIFGKTGTAQVPDRVRGGYEPDAYVGSFICGAPLDEPVIVVGCFIHRPEKSRGYYGGMIAAPAAMQVVEQTLTYLGLPPDADTPRAQTRYVQAD